MKFAPNSFGTLMRLSNTRDNLTPRVTGLFEAPRRAKRLPAAATYLVTLESPGGKSPAAPALASSSSLRSPPTGYVRVGTFGARVIRFGR